MGIAANPGDSLPIDVYRRKPRLESSGDAM